MTRHRAGKKPVVGVTGPDRGGLAAWLFTWYSVHKVGGRAVRIRPGHPRDIDALDALVIGGGADVHPSLYGEPLDFGLDAVRRRSRRGLRALLRALVYPLIVLVRRLLSTKRRVGGDTGRDELETRLIREALARGIPVLGICRGAQLLNVVCGGSLHQSLDDFYQETPNVRSIRPAKHVRIESDSRLAQVLGLEAATVNALHRQAIKEPGAGLRPVAFEATAVIQAIEHTEHSCVFGVQWHPEYMPQRTEQRRLFRAVVERARGCAIGESGELASTG